MLLCIQAFKLKSYKWMDGMGMESILWMDAPLLRAPMCGANDKITTIYQPNNMQKRNKMRCV